ncbi:MAG: ABC transporter permease [Sphingobacterium sp.]|uniref:ABC transporter permease n=1 Tax=Sphingobacterium sp. JB170 TaxID=1434842 RepID=UPI000B35D1D9|nr:ABC transporter permease [Sphingobacterium sp. JB170]
MLTMMFMMPLVPLILMLACGFFTHRPSMPDWAITISHFTHVTHFIKAVRLIALIGTGLSETKNVLGYLLMFADALNGMRYRITEKQVKGLRSLGVKITERVCGTQAGLLINRCVKKLGARRLTNKK